MYYTKLDKLNEIAGVQVNERVKNFNESSYLMKIFFDYYENI